MSTDPREGHPPDLARQLDRLEQIGNAEAELASAEGTGRDGRRRAIILDDRRHRDLARATRRRRERERSRRLGLLLLCLSPLLTLAYALAGYLGRGTLALVLLLAAAATTAAAVVVLYVSREREDAV